MVQPFIYKQKRIRNYSLLDCIKLHLVDYHRSSKNSLLLVFACLLFVLALRLAVLFPTCACEWFFFYNQGTNLPRNKTRIKAKYNKIRHSLKSIAFSKSPYTQLPFMSAAVILLLSILTRVFSFCGWKNKTS